MTMINHPSHHQKLSKQHFIHSYGCDSFVHMSRLQAEAEAEKEKGYVYSYCHSQLQAMAEDESRTESINEPDDSGSKDDDNNNNNNNDGVMKVREKEQKEEEEEGWLQLSIGSGSHEKKPPPGGRLGLVELDLLPPGPGGSSSSTNYHEQASKAPSTNIFQVPEFRAPPLPQPPLRPPFINTSLFLQHPTAGSTSSAIFPQEINWGLIRPMGASTMASSSSSQYLMNPRPFPVLDFRVIDPPRRPHSGIWFSLQASLNQAKEPFLHQISKSYLRIKDGRMTIRLVLKYLVNKLQLENESEIEITCRGQQLQPFLTLQHVRDHIWSNSPTTLTLLPPQSSNASNHVMVLHYGRSPSN